MSLLRRRPMIDGGANGGKPHFKPFVLPIKANKATNNNDDQESTPSRAAQRNRQALRNGGSLAIKRLPFLSFVKDMEPEQRMEQAQKLRQPFKSPCDAAGSGVKRSAESQRLLQVKTLGMRRRWAGNALMKPMVQHELTVDEYDLYASTTEPESSDLPILVEEFPSAELKPDAPPPLVLWESSEDPNVKVVVPDIVGKFLRPHQREGVQFMFDCVCQIRGFDGQGCILADDMGLGKTLQSITLMYTLLMTGMSPTMEPTIKRAIVVCPTSLVKNWDDEIIKWLHGRVKTIALFESNRETVIKNISQFIEGSKRPRPGVSAQVLVISYETFRMHAQKLIDNPECCELLICDEAHRLKNANSQINRALSSLACRKRVLLSGTPMQNDLEEFFAMVDFTNPNILGSPSEFRKEYLNPILVGREPDATEKETDVAQTCSAMLCEIVNQFILRRGNILNAKHLPPKLMQVVCCPLSSLQEQLYTHFLASSSFRDMMRKENVNVLSSITALKKLCNHPLLIFDEMGKSNTKLPGFENCAHFFTAARQKASSGNTSTGTQNRRGGFGERTCYSQWSGKMLLLDRLMLSMKKLTTDRIVIVSNYTQTLDVVSTLCRERHLPFVRLDGTTSAKKRKKLVDTFNDPTTNSFAFLLSSKAGGCGLNLIGANRLVLFDPDWNPATDKQAAARVWREGQKKMCYVYRFLATGTLEEKIFQRQLSKEGLQNIVDDKEEVNALSSKDLKRLFVFRQDTMSDTHDQLNCERCQWRNTSSSKGDESVVTIDSDKDETDGNATNEESSHDDMELEKNYHPQIGMPPEEDLNSWGHHRSYDSVDDAVMQDALKEVRADLVSFAFSCRVDWQLLQEHQVNNEEKEIQREEERKRKRLEKIEAASARKTAELNAKNKEKQKKQRTKKRKLEDEGEESDEFTESSSEEEEQEDDADEEEEEDIGDEPNNAESSDSEREMMDAPRIDQTLSGSPSLGSGKSLTRSSPISDLERVVPVSSIKKRVSFDQGDLNTVASSANKATPQGQKQVGRFSVANDDDLNGLDELSSVPAPVLSVAHEQLSEDEETKVNETYQEEESKWNCTRCTLENPFSNDICGGCGLRFRRSRLQPTPQFDWDNI